MKPNMTHVDKNTPIQFLKGVGPKVAQTFQDRGIYCIGDLLEWYPRAYEDRRAARNISSLKPGETVALRAYVSHTSSIKIPSTGNRIHRVILKDSTGEIECLFFRLPYKSYMERFFPNMLVTAVGKITEHRGRPSMVHPEIQDTKLQSDDELTDLIVPIYTEVKGLSRRRLLRIFEQALNQGELIPETLPARLREKYKLENLWKSIQSVHSPPEDAGSNFLTFQSQYHRRIIFEEFLAIELPLALSTLQFQTSPSPQISRRSKLFEALLKITGFTLTEDQHKVLEEILSDLDSPGVMHRLLQGEVGSGKTIVAFLAAAAAVDSGYQVAIMAPTEILAEQHYQSALKWFSPLGVQVLILTGQFQGRDRLERLNQISTAASKVIIGTHSLIQPDVSFERLGLVIIDEQQRFGVEQRKALLTKGSPPPHLLVMSATPIPRTLALTLFGDLKLSTICTVPKGRLPVSTHLVPPTKREDAFQFLRQQIQQGRQAYIIYPLIDDEEQSTKTAVHHYKTWTEKLSPLSVGLLHGQLKFEEKSRVIDSFRKGEIQVLVATTVIEVGIDVPNANLMMIEHCEHFGLSQLHQLRGRVGRGSHKSYCLLMTTERSSPESLQRMNILARTQNGFEIAEADLVLRGPGEFLGSRQSGLPPFKMADLSRDRQILEEARSAAFELARGIDGPNGHNRKDAAHNFL